MNTARMLSAAAAAAVLFSGSAALAQTSPNTPSTGQPADAQGATPATDDAQTDANRQTPPTAPGDTATSNASQPAPAPGTMTNQEPMAPQSMPSAVVSGDGPVSAGSMPSGAMPSTTMPMSGEAMATGNVRVTANAPIPDTPENRARYGQPESNAGKRSRGEGPVGSRR